MPCKKTEIFLLTIFALFAAVAATKTAHAYKGEIFVIEMTKEGFLPQEIEIRRGQKVVFKNTDNSNHWPELKLKNKDGLDAGPLESVLPKESWGFEFEKTGLWELRDHNFPEFSGSILAKDDNGYTPGRPEEKPQETRSTRPGKIVMFFKNIFQNFLAFFSKNQKSAAALDPTEILNDDKKLIAYIKKYGAGKTIAEIEKITNSQECHNRTHLVGKYAYQIFKNNAFQWHAFAFDAACNSGFFHGLMDELRNDGGSLKGVCEKSPFSLKCDHDVGHSLMAAGDYKLYDVLKMCESLSENKLGQEECFRGTFMENTDGGINHEAGHVSKYLSKDPLYPCTEVPEKYKSACYQFALGRFHSIHNKNFEDMLKTCARFPKPINQTCFADVGTQIAVEYFADQKKIVEFCSKAKGDKAGTMCLIGAAAELVSNPKTRKSALDFCDTLENQTSKSNCYNSALSSATRFLGENFEKFCATLSGQQKDSCLNFKEPRYIFQQQ